MALLGLRQLDAGKESFEEAQRAFMEAQHPRGRAEALRGIALVEAMQDRREAASASYAEMIRIFQQIGAGEDVARGLNQMGNLNLDAGDLDQAETIYKQALNVARKIHDPRAEATVLHNLAKLTFGRGRPIRSTRPREPSAASPPSCASRVIWQVRATSTASPSRVTSN
jgi:tetratricopeptide (TPR) repeat protein